MDVVGRLRLGQRAYTGAIGTDWESEHWQKQECRRLYQSFAAETVTQQPLKHHTNPQISRNPCWLPAQS